MLRALDIFAGAVGGWSLGLSRAGITTVAACEIDAWRRAVFQAHHPRCRMMYEDVRELTAARLADDLGYLPDIVVGSPPCQEISAANSKGEGITDDHLFWEWVRLVFEVRPVWCAAENSPRARTTGIDGILDALDQASYATWPLVVGADNAGANHRRKRMWLIAADALRIGLWQQPGRSDGPSGRAAAVAREHDPNADCLAQGRLARQERQPRPKVGHVAYHCSDDPHPHPDRQHGCALDGEMGGGMDGAVGDADCKGQPLGSCERDNDGAELPPALRAIGRSWPHWSGGLAGLAASCAAAWPRVLDDGLPAILAPNLRNRAIAALGDAVLPQITEAIARAMNSGVCGGRA